MRYKRCDKIGRRVYFIFYSRKDNLRDEIMKEFNFNLTTIKEQRNFYTKKNLIFEEKLLYVFEAEKK